MPLAEEPSKAAPVIVLAVPVAEIREVRASEYLHLDLMQTVRTLATLIVLRADRIYLHLHGTPLHGLVLPSVW